MNVLFLTLLDFSSFSEHNIYCDLLREFISHGHDVYCISPTERKHKVATHMEENGHLLKLRIGNTQKTNFIEKGISTLLIEPMMVGAIKNYFGHVKFNLVLYSTPPITLAKAVQYVKKRDNARTYLLLKDIFPQNAVDLGLMSPHGLHSLLYHYFRWKETVLYRLSDHIGCMSEANVAYFLQNNPEIDQDRVSVCPNCVEVQTLRADAQKREQIRSRYGLPQNVPIYVCGGNLGKPQGVPFIIECLRQIRCTDMHFLIVGSGTDFGLIEEYCRSTEPPNLTLMKALPQETFDELLTACDVGLLFLDNRFTIPNFPSRMLSYMQAGLPVLACTDSNTDVGKTIVEGGFGWWCESTSPERFAQTLRRSMEEDQRLLGARAYEYLCEKYSAEVAYKTLMMNCEKMCGPIG